MSEPSVPEPLAPIPPPSPIQRLAEAWNRLREGDSPVPALVAVAVLALVAGLIWYRAGLRQGEDLVPDVVPAAAAAASASETSATTGPGAKPAALVHVAGAVATPGLYHLPADARVADAITAAGGPAPAAEVDRLNLAAKVADGQRIAVPRRGEPTETAPVETGGAGPSGSGGEPSGPVDLNNATATQLETLPGVGPATAARIIDQRTRQGGFKTVRDLLRVPGIGERRFAELKDRVRV